MKKILCFFIILTIFAINESGAEIFPPQILSDDWNVDAGERHVADGVLVVAPITITNRGTLTGGIAVARNVRIIVVNDGDLSATFDLSAGATLYQYISSLSEMTGLTVIGGTYIPVIGEYFYGRINAADLLLLYDGAARIRIEAPKPVMDVFESELRELARRLDITDGLVLNVLDYAGAPLDPTDFGFNGHVIFSHGGGEGLLFVYHTGDNGETSRVRETDYIVILGKNDKRAGFLNMVRMRNPNDRILAKLDRAETMDGLLSAMNRSMFFNPRALNGNLVRMALRSDFGGPAPRGFYTGARTGADGVLAGNDFILGFQGEGFSAAAGFYVGRAEENDDYKYGRADVRGIRAELRAGAFGFGIKAFQARWRDITIMSGDEIKTGAESRLFYSFMDFSPSLGFENIRPVIRANYLRSEIEEHKSGGLFLSCGVRVSFSEKAMGMENRFGAYATAGPRQGFGRPAESDFGIFAETRFIEDAAAFAVKLSPSNLSIEIKAAF